MQTCASVRANAYCAVDGIGERLPLNILEGKERERILAEQKNRARVLFGVITKRGKRGLASVKDVRLVDAPILGRKLRTAVAGGRACAARLGRGYQDRERDRDHRSADASVPGPAAVFGALHVPARQRQRGLHSGIACAARVHRAGGARHRIEDRIACADGQVHRPTIDPNVATVDSVEFKGPFAERSEATIVLPNDLKDDAGRALANAAAFPMKVRIDDDPPLVKFPSRFGILEVNAQPALPVTVRNVEPMLDAYALDVAKAPRVAAKGRIKRIDTDDDAALARVDAPHAARARGRRASPKWRVPEARLGADAVGRRTRSGRSRSTFRAQSRRWRCR